MTSPTVSSSESESPNFTTRTAQLPLVVRRCGAWIIEISLIASSSLVPITLGILANQDPTTTVPLNPVVTKTTEAISQVLAIPRSDRSPRVAPLTNLLWSVGILAPIALSGWQLYLLAKLGQTSPKRWLGVKVADISGNPPGVSRVLVREGLGRWGIPLGIALGLWRLTGAFPDLLILGGMASLTLLGEALMARWDSQRRTAHDRLAGTFVIDSRQSIVNPFIDEEWTPEDQVIATIVVTPEEASQYRGLWGWMRQHPGTTLLIVSCAGMTAVLGTFIGTQVYIQSQTNIRDFKQRDDQVFLALVGKLSATTPNITSDRRSAILALGAVNDPRATPFLKDLLAQEDNPALLEVIQQALVSRGIAALPYLQQLNQAVSNDLDSMQFGGNSKEKEFTTLRLRATQRAIAKILTVYSGGLNNITLERVNLSQTPSGPAQFTLVLNKTDLSGINFKNSNLSNGSLEGTRFVSAGDDKRFGTFDDWLADLSGANLEGVNLNNAQLSNISLTRANLLRSTLNKANLNGANLNHANLSSVKLIQASLKKATLKETSLTGADLGTANLEEANLERARLSQAKAQGVVFKGGNLSKSDWSGADLSGADLRSTQLSQVNFRGAKLIKADLRNAQLQDAQLQNADLSWVDWRGSQLKGANFKGAILINSKSGGGNEFISKPSAKDKTGRLDGVNFSEAKNLDASQIAYICLQGGIHPRCPQKN